MTYADPPAPRPFQYGELPPAQSYLDLLSSGDQPNTWAFNPEYQRLVDLWLKVIPHMEELTKVLDKAYQMASSTDVWDAPIAKRYVEDISECRKRLAMYRHAVLSAISEEADETQRLVPSKFGIPRTI